MVGNGLECPLGASGIMVWCGEVDLLIYGKKWGLGGYADAKSNFLRLWLEMN